MGLTSKASAEWQGALETGKGSISLQSSGVLTDTPYNFKARKDGENGVVTPEELLGAAHAACFSMAFSLVLGGKDIVAESIHTTANVTFDVLPTGPAITSIKLVNVSRIPGLDDAQFQLIAQDVAANCPVSKALAGVDISLEARLEQ